MKQLKWTALCKWLSKRKTFGWSEMNRAFGHKPASLNSYTTYLNTLRRAGYVVQVARGQYKVLDHKHIATLSRSEVDLQLTLQDADVAIKDVSDLNVRQQIRIVELCSQVTELKELAKRAVGVGERCAEELITTRRRSEELSTQIVSMDDRARGTKLQRLVAVIRRELNR